MRILQINIQSFGKWTDKTIAIDGDGLQSFYGENESGKSTMQSFILYMLFGLSKKDCEFYRPKGRGHIAGQLRLEIDKQKVTLHRQNTDLTVYLEDGSVVDEAWWNQQLKGVNRSTYQAIYAFDTQELMSIREMKQADLSDILISVGLTGSKALYEREKELEKELDALFKPTGKNPQLNQQIKKVTDIEADYQVEKEKEAPYFDLVTSLADKEKSLRKLQAQVLDLDENLEKYKSRLQYSAEIEAYYEKQQAMKDYETPIPFPEDGLARWDNLKATMLPIEIEKENLLQEIKKKENKIDELNATLYDKEKEEKMAALIDQESSYNQARANIEAMGEKLKRKEIEYEEQLNQLNWQENLAQEKPLSFADVSDLEALIDNDKMLHKNDMDYKHQQGILDKNIHRLNEKLADKRSQQISSEEKFEHENILDQYEQKSQQAKRRNQIKGKSFQFISIVLLVLAAFSAVSALMIPAKIIYVLAILLFFLAAYVFYLDKSRKLSFEGDTMTLSELSKAAHMAKEALEEQAQLSGDINALQADLDYQKRDLEKLEEKLVTHRNQWQQHQALCQTTLDEFPYFAGFELPYWSQVMAVIGKLRDIEKSIKNLTKEKEENNDTIQAIEQDMRILDIADNFKQLKEMSLQQSGQKNFIRDLTEEIESLREDLEAKESQLTVYHTHRKELLTLAKAVDEEAYLERSNVFANYKQLVSDLKQLQIKLEAVFTDEEIAQFKAHLISKVHLEEVIQSAETEKAAVEADLRARQSEITSLKYNIEQLEKKTDLSLLNYEKQIALDEMNELATEWAVKKAELNMIAAAKQNFQEKYLERVLTYTRKIFGQLTQQKYKNVFAPLKTQLFQVEDKHHVRYNVSELSQGTVDQLYIALRFAIARVMNEIHPLPMLVDDAFVHFDDRRLAEGLNLLKDKSQSQQIFFFTCKSDIAKKLDSKALIEV